MSTIFGQLEAIDERVDQLLSKVCLIDARLGVVPADECVPQHPRITVEDYIGSIRADVCRADDIAANIVMRLGESPNTPKCVESKTNR
jgi:hypothetical protein